MVLPLHYFKIMTESASWPSPWTMKPTTSCLPRWTGGLTRTEVTAEIVRAFWHAGGVSFNDGFSIYVWTRIMNWIFYNCWFILLFWALLSLRGDSGWFPWKHLNLDLKTSCCYSSLNKTGTEAYYEACLRSKILCFKMYCGWGFLDKDFNFL